MPLVPIQPEHYQQQLDDKAERLGRLLAPFAAPVPEVFASPPLHYRMRAEFRFWRNGTDSHFAMTGPDRRLVRVDAFPVACERICALMPRVLQALQQHEQLRAKLFQVEFLAATTGDCVLTLAYHRPLDAAWQEAGVMLQAALGCAVIGRSRGQKIVLDRDYVEETFSVGGAHFTQRQPESAFSQPNASVNQHMLNWAHASCAGIGGDLLELYCGNGNFTLPLSRLFDKVLATEVSKASVQALQHNVSANQCNNIALARLSSEELTDAINGVRPFRRLSHIDLADYRFSTVLVDPPRAGLDAATCQLLQRFDHILYLSCNPDTLAANLKTLCQSHSIVRTALFDQFPYTHHMEAGVFLQRRKP